MMVASQNITRLPFKSSNKQTLPSISIIIPTFNSAKTLRQCLTSIAHQDYSPGLVEIIVADGGSVDSTLKIVSEFSHARVVHNRLRTGEAGKAVGAEHAKNEILAFIDSDNILPSVDWLRQMVIPFSDETVVGSEPLYYSHRRMDPLITRYCALLGMNDTLCLFLGNYDRYCSLTGKWTETRVTVSDMGSYLRIILNGRSLPTLGANGFLVRAATIKKLSFRSYLFDVDMVYQLVSDGHNVFAKVKVGIVHLFARDLREYIRKTRRRVSDYVHFDEIENRRYPWTQLGIAKTQRFILNTLLLIPLVNAVAKGYRRSPDNAWLFHPMACWITLLVYASSSLGWLAKGVRRNRTRESE